MNIPEYVSRYRKDLEMKNYAKSSIENYCSQVALFLRHFSGKYTEPCKINEESIKGWIMLANSINGRKHRISALKIFYIMTVHQPLKFKHIAYPRSEKKLPIVLSVDEIQKMFDVCKNTKHRVILALLYSCGFRVSELINLKWEHIDRYRGVINVVAGKGKKDRQVMLATTLIPLLEKYYMEYRPAVYVLNGQTNDQYTETSVNNVVKQLASAAGIRKRVYTHLIRHCSFTHMAEAGTDINLIQRIAGHNNVKTTAIYLHLSDSTISKINSPISTIAL